MRPLLIALAAAVVAATASLACGQDEEVVTPDATVAPASESAATGAWTAPSGTPVPKPGWTTLRLLNMTASAPEDIIVALLPGYTFSATRYYGRPVVTIEPRGRDDVRIVIDAETGAIVEQVGSDLELAALHPVLDTVRVSPFDPKTAPWPYADTAPPDDRADWWELTYPLPDASTGIRVGTYSGIGGPAGECGHTILVWNGRSRMALNACTGEAISYATTIDPADAEAFERFRGAVEVKR